MTVVSRLGPAPVALETTLLVYGVPRDRGTPLAHDLARIVADHAATPVFVGIHAGRPVVGLNDRELHDLLTAEAVVKVNTSNLGIVLHRGQHGATTVSATMELAAAAGVRVFATGGIGGLHHGYGTRWDASADLAALARFPVAVVCSGVKSLLDVESSREYLESLGVPVIGFATDVFPAFYLRESQARVDARFDDVNDLAAFIDRELRRSGRGVLIVQPVPHSAAIARDDWLRWLSAAHAAAPAGREATPAILDRLHALSGGVTLEANIVMVRTNAVLAARLAHALAQLIRSET